MRAPSLLCPCLLCLVTLCLAPAASAQADLSSEPNAKNWDEMMHYITIGRWELAQGYGKALLDGNPDPQLLLDLALALFGPWMLQKMLDSTTALFEAIPGMTR